MVKLIAVPIAVLCLTAAFWRLSRDTGDGTPEWTKAKAVWARELGKVILLGMVIVSFSALPILFILVMIELGRGR